MSRALSLVTKIVLTAVVVLGMTALDSIIRQRWTSTQAEAPASPPDPYLVVLSSAAKSRVVVWTDPETDCQYLATYSAGLVLIPRTGRDGLVICTRPAQPAQEPAR